MVPILVLVVFVALLFLAAYLTKKNNDKLKQQGFDVKNMIDVGCYKCGHPDMDKPGQVCNYVYLKDSDLYIFTCQRKQIAKIPEQSIKSIQIEDATTVQKRVTVTRMLAFGIFAFALKKKSKEEMSYLIIEWTTGRFNHETVFEFKGKGAVQKSNSARNSLIKLIERN